VPGVHLLKNPHGERALVANSTVAYSAIVRIFQALRAHLAAAYDKQVLLEGFNGRRDNDVRWPPRCQGGEAFAGPRRRAAAERIKSGRINTTQWRSSKSELAGFPSRQSLQSVTNLTVPCLARGSQIILLQSLAVLPV